MNKQSERQNRYDKKHITQLMMKLHNEIDADIIEKLQEVPNKTGYIKSLIRADISKNKTGN